MKRPRVPVERFVKIWTNAKSGGDAAAALGMSLQVAQSRASALRRKYHIPLKKFPTARQVDWAGLSRLARQIPNREHLIPHQWAARMAAKESFYREFILVFQNAKSLDEICRRFSMTRGRVHHTSKQLRKYGVPLKKFARLQSYNWLMLREEARRILKELAAGRSVSVATKHKREPFPFRRKRQ